MKPCSAFCIVGIVTEAPAERYNNFSGAPMDMLQFEVRVDGVGRDGAPCTYECQAWGARNKAAVQALRVGDAVCVHGRFANNPYKGYQRISFYSQSARIVQLDNETDEFSPPSATEEMGYGTQRKLL